MPAPLPPELSPHLLPPGGELDGSRGAGGGQTLVPAGASPQPNPASGAPLLCLLSWSQGGGRAFRAL